MIGERAVEDLSALTMTSEAGELEVTYVPRAGMVGCSLRHRGEELLGQRSGLRAYLDRHSTMGIPLLHPWANRVGSERFEVAGRQVALDSGPVEVSRDPAGLPIHGLLAAARGWRVERREATGEGGVLAASFDFAAHQDLLAMFPFPHRIEIETTLSGATLTVRTTVSATAETLVPIAFGYHPYLRVPGLDRAAWEIGVPVSERLVLDDRMLPTGDREPVTVEPGPLGSRTFDDGYLAPADERPLVLAGGGRRIEVSIGPGYGFAQVYAPADDDVVAYEPMTAPTNALVTGGSALPLLEPGASYEASFSITVAEGD